MSILRAVLERVSRGRSFRRRLPARFGSLPMYVTPDAALSYWTKSLDTFDPALLRAAEQLVRSGDTVWDIGANAGLFTFAAAARAGRSGRVLAIEADSWMAELIRKSARLHRDGQRAPVDVVSVAAGERTELASFVIARRGRASNFLAGAGREPAGGVREVQRVVCVTLDWLLEHYAAPQLIKIDVEGAELDLLRGAPRLLRETRPLILCEVGEQNGKEVGALFCQAGYQLFDSSASPIDRKPLAEAPWDTLAVPSEAVAALSGHAPGQS